MCDAPCCLDESLSLGLSDHRECTVLSVNGPALQIIILIKAINKKTHFDPIWA